MTKNTDPRTTFGLITAATSILVSISEFQELPKGGAKGTANAYWLKYSRY